VTIPEAQLETWSKQGAAGQSRDTYATVKRTLEDHSAPYASKSFITFLQGSYGNDTNVYRDSDVDIVIRLDSTFYHDAHTLPIIQHAAFDRAYPGAAQYSLTQFKAEVNSWLVTNFGSNVRSGKKAIFILGNGNRRDCDVLPAAQYRYYYNFTNQNDQRYAVGICFFLPDGTQIVNYPMQHSENCTAKHQATNNWFKPIMRIYKNMRNHMVNNKMLQDGVAPSYFIEGLLYNVPNDKFGISYADTVVATFNYLVDRDRSEFKCANGIHKLLENNSHVSWPPVNCQAFLDKLRQLWTDWR
jgi:hypothetical protein